METVARTLYLVDVFTGTIGAGNRAGVVLDADGLDTAAMQRIAASVDAGETAFGLRSSDPADHDLEVRYFSRTRELPLCGHATIAFHHVRALEHGLPTGTLRVKTGAGVLPIDIVRNGDGCRVVMTQREPRVLHTLSPSERSQVQAALGLAEADAMMQWPAQVVCTGHAKVMVPVRRWAALDALSPDRARLIELSGRLGATGYFAFTLDVQRDDVLYHARMFGPASGVDEDPVTGNANGPAGFYLLSRGCLAIPSDGVHRYRAVQGETMGRPGLIDVYLSRGADARVRVQVTGDAVIAQRRAIGECVPDRREQGNG